MLKKSSMLLTAAIVAAVLVGCDSKPDVSGPLTPEQQEIKTAIEIRIAGYKDMGAAFKAINDELKAGHPESTTVKFSAKALQSLARDSKFWFKENSGQGSGFDTNAKDSIWASFDEFKSLQEELNKQAEAMVEAANTSDADTIGAQFQNTGKVCKQCHDKYREEDE